LQTTQPLRYWRHFPYALQTANSHWPALLRLFAWVIALGIVLVVSQALLLTSRQPTLQLAIDSIQARPLLEGFHGVETDGAQRYRWTSDTSVIRFAPVAQGDAAVLNIEMQPPTGRAGLAATISVDDQSLAVVSLSEQSRSYQFLLPSHVAQQGAFRVSIESEAVIIPPDERPLGVRIDGATLTYLSNVVVWPALPVVAAQTLFLWLAALLAYRLAAPAGWIIGSLLVSVVLIALLYVNQSLLIFPYVGRLAVVLAILLVCTYVFLPYVKRAMPQTAPHVLHTLWGIAALCILVRFTGILYPPFQIHDMPYHTNWLEQTSQGDLVILTRPLEFHRGVIVYPQGIYAAMLPGLLLGATPQMLIHGVLGVVDGVVAFSTALLARRLGASDRAAVFSALLMIGMPISLYILWWGFTTQIVGQALIAPLALVLIQTFQRPSAWGWWISWVLLSVVLLSHISITLLTAAWLGLAWLGLWRTSRGATRIHWRFLLLLTLGGICALALCYAPFVSSMIAQVLAPAQPTETPRFDRLGTVQLVISGFRTAFHELGVLLMLLGLFLLRWRAQSPGAAALTGAWIGVVLFFLAVEFWIGRQVRYIYFLIPLVCVLIGLVLDRLVQRGRNGRWIAWMIVLLISFQGFFAWYEGVFEEIRPPVVSLTR
jgi:hypothetical protein